jgi:hypothetical protein
MASQTRIVLDETQRPKAEEILKATGISTFSQLFSIFIANYGDHLVNALKSVPGTHAQPSAVPVAPAPVSQSQQLTRITQKPQAHSPLSF